MRPLLILAGVAALALPQTARAASLAAALCADADQDGRISRAALRNAIIQRAKIPFGALDANGDDEVSADEWFAALTTDAAAFCTIGTGGRTVPCDDATPVALFNADDALASFWEQRGKVFDVTGADTFAADRPWRALLDPNGTAAAICRPGPKPKPKQPSPFLLGKDVASLTVDRGDPDDADRLAKVDPAVITLVSDRAAHTRTASIDAVAGYKLLDRPDLKLIPFIQYSREETKDKAAGTKELTGKLAFGALASARLAGTLDFAPLYAKDLETKAELLGARLAWRPAFLYGVPTFQNAEHFGCATKRNGVCPAGRGLGVWSDLQLVSAFGTVLDKGNDPKFVENREYLRAGPSASIHVYGQSGFVRDLSLDVAYSRLFHISGDGGDVTSFSTNLRWWIAGSQHVALIYGYERSRDEETLELTDQWKLGLGVRF